MRPSNPRASDAVCDTQGLLPEVRAGAQVSNTSTIQEFRTACARPEKERNFSPRTGELAEIDAIAATLRDRSEPRQWMDGPNACNTTLAAGHLPGMHENAAVGASRSTQRQQRFEALYAEHHPRVFGYVMRRCERADDGADAIAETFLVVWRRLDEAPEAELLPPWLYGIARRVLANQRRGERRRTALAQQLELDFARHPLPRTTAFETAVGERAVLRDALASLDEDDRELLALEAWEDLDAGQIAQVVGCSAGAARTRLHRARSRLQAALTADERECPTEQEHPVDRDRPVTSPQPTSTEGQVNA